MTEPHIVIATPCFGGTVTHTYMMSVLHYVRAAEKAGYRVNLLTLGGDSLISRARSILVSHFLETPGATHLLFIDADIAFEPEQVHRLLAADKEFAAAFYPLKRTDWSKLPLHAMAGEPLERAGLSYVGQLCEGSALRLEGDFATALYAGTGFQLIRRCVFERMIAAYPDLRFRAVHTGSERPAPPEYLCALFDCIIDPDGSAYLSEDYSFCRRWRALGGEIWLDLDSKLTHTGPQAFQGDCAQRFAGLRDRPPVLDEAA